MAALLDLSNACATVRSFDDARTCRLGPALLAPLRLPIDLWPPPPSPQGDATGRFPHRASLLSTPNTVCEASIAPDETVPPSSAGLESDWRVQIASRIERHTARSVRMSALSGQLGKLELSHSTRACDPEDGEFLGSLLTRLPSLSDVETNFDTSALHSVSQRSPPLSPSATSFDASLDHTLEDGIHTPTFCTLPPDPFDALDALEALAALQPLCPGTPRDEHLEPMEALLWSPGSYDVHPFRTQPKGSHLYASSDWCEVPPPLPPKDTCGMHLPSAQRRSLDLIKSAGVAATHRRAESAPSWPQATQIKPKRAWRIAQVQPAPDAATAWAKHAPHVPTDQSPPVKHFHHHHYHHHHIHYHDESS